MKIEYSNTRINYSKIRVLENCIKSPSIEYSMLDGGITSGYEFLKNVTQKAKVTCIDTSGFTRTTFACLADHGNTVVPILMNCMGKLPKNDWFG